MATVYVATDLRLERRIALKVMHGHLSDDTVFQSRFIQEARAAARLADPHVVNVFDQGQDGDMAYLVMEYLPGITLRELMREQRRLTIPQTITIMDAILSGLAAAHRAGIVHRDVKPENVLLAEDGRIKIGDFGLARATTANTATGAQLLGTIAYLAPELVTRGTADARSDIYALGILLYEMLTGEQPYKGEQPMQIAFQHATDSVPRPSVKNPGVPEALDELVLWATERSPDDRPMDAREMLDRLREIERELGISPQVTRTSTIGITRDEGIASGELTQVLPVTGGIATAPIDDADNATRLRRATRRRSVKGAWLVAVVLLLTGLAGGAGWWFGSGPGSLVVVADVSGGTYAEAQARLLQDTLITAERGETSLDVPAGQVIRTDPDAGARVDRETSVDVYVSQGPAEATFSSFLGIPEADARTILGDQFVAVAEDSSEFYTDSASGSVIGVMIRPAGAPDDGSQDVACGEGCTVRQGDAATLWISLGPLPDVAGESADNAAATLSNLGITVSERPEEFSETVEDGRVIRMTDRSGGGWWRPGDSTTLIVSKGPAPVEVPDVDGESVAEAVRILREAGLNPTSNVPELVWGLFTATGTNPEAGSLVARGSNVRIVAFG